MIPRTSRKTRPSLALGHSEDQESVTITQASCRTWGGRTRTWNLWASDGLENPLCGWGFDGQQILVYLVWALPSARAWKKRPREDLELTCRESMNSYWDLVVKLFKLNFKVILKLSIQQIPQKLRLLQSLILPKYDLGFLWTQRTPIWFSMRITGEIAIKLIPLPVQCFNRKFINIRLALLERGFVLACSERGSLLFRLRYFRVVDLREVLRWLA